MLWRIRVRRRHRTAFAAVLLVVLAVIGTRQGWFVGTAQGVMTSQPGLYAIDHYIDGDTIAVNMNGTVEMVRFIGIDTPETHKPDTPVECYGPQAAAYTQAQIKAAGGRVRLVSDSLSTNRDRYNRLLRYVYLPDGTDLNERIVATGHGFYYPYFPFSNKTRFAAAEKSAMTADQGLWAACSPTPSDDGGYKMDEPAG